MERGLRGSSCRWSSRGFGGSFLSGSSVGDADGGDGVVAECGVQGADDLGFEAVKLETDGGVGGADAGDAVRNGGELGAAGDEGADGFGPGAGENFGGEFFLLQVQVIDELGQQSLHAVHVTPRGEGVADSVKICPRLVDSPLGAGYRTLGAFTDAGDVIPVEARARVAELRRFFVGLLLFSARGHRGKKPGSTRPPGLR